MDHAATLQRMYDLVNAGDIDGFGDLLAEDFVEHEVTPGLAPTKEGVKTFFRAYRAAFPDLRMTTEDVMSSGDRAVARVRATGTNQGDFMVCRPPARAWTCSSSTSCGSATTASSTSTGVSSIHWR